MPLSWQAMAQVMSRLNGVPPSPGRAVPLLQSVPPSWLQVEEGGDDQGADGGHSYLSPST